MHARTKRLKAHVLVRIAAAAGADPRTVKNYCEGGGRDGLAHERIEKALKAAGIAIAGTEQTP